MCKFRDLRADEIECRIGQIGKEDKGLSLLLYKDARCDMAILDETVGTLNWQRALRSQGQHVLQGEHLGHGEKHMGVEIRLRNGIQHGSAEGRSKRQLQASLRELGYRTRTIHVAIHLDPSEPVRDQEPQMLRQV